MNSKFESAYVQKVHDDTQRYLGELKGQNERLRLQVAALESDRNRLQQEKLRVQGELIAAREELTRRQDEHSSLMRRLGEVELENERVAAQFLDIETQNTNLANLYVASYQLRSSLQRSEILSAVREIIVNLIGCEDFAIFERSEGTDHVTLIDSFDGRHTRETGDVPLGQGIIGSVAQSGQPYLSADDRGRAAGITACVPLKIDANVVGVIAIFRLLPQKSNVLGTLDHELLDLLAAQAGVALYCSRLHASAR